MKTMNALFAAIMTAAPAQLRADAAAQVMTDPTRPSGAVAAATGDGAPAAPLLQSVMITPTTRLAIIGGETVHVGGKYGEARVVRITESTVVLRTAGGAETLRMYPGVELTVPKPRVSAPPTAARNSARNNPQGSRMPP
jgi:MSHA biogenesis protein MshK